MNVLYISYDGMTDPLGQSQVLPYLTGLSKSGYRFKLVPFEPTSFQHFVGRIVKNFDFNEMKIGKQASDIFGLKVGIRSHQLVRENMLQEERWQQQTIENP